MKQASFYFDPKAKGLAVFMGKTEALVMDLVWKHEKLTIKRALTLINTTPKPAYTTLMTIFNRLVEKKMLTRIKDSRHFVYSAPTTKEQFLSKKLETIRKTLNENFPDIL